LAKAEHQSFSTNRLGLNDELRGESARRTFAPLRAAFDVIAEAGSTNNELALEAVGRATQNPELRGFAIQSAGTIAGNGNDAAVEFLLNPEKNGFLLSEAVGALRAPAEKGNQKAIEALAAVTKDANRQALWYMAASGLGNAAESGNSAAIDALIGLSASTNQNVQSAVIAGLKRAASNQNAKAAEALRSMSVQ
jgi:hypothetical protein